MNANMTAAEIAEYRQGYIRDLQAAAPTGRPTLNQIRRCIDGIGRPHVATVPNGYAVISLLSEHDPKQACDMAMAYLYKVDAGERERLSGHIKETREYAARCAAEVARLKAGGELGALDEFQGGREDAIERAQRASFQAWKDMALRLIESYLAAQERAAWAATGEGGEGRGASYATMGAVDVAAKQ